MDILDIDLENCYGINKAKVRFDFSDQAAYAIYAPNGSMKSSFAQTLKDEADQTASRDRIFTKRVCTRKIVDEAGKPLSPDSILVIRPYDEVFGHSERTST